MCKVSFIVPVYNAAKTIRRCINSILRQSYLNIELILIDDGSPDNCGAICDEYAAEDSRVKVIHKENGGVASARNSGLDNAVGKYIMFVDADDYVESTLAEICVNIMEKGVDLLLFDYYDAKKRRVKNNRDKYYTSVEAAKMIADNSQNILGFLWNKFFKREIVRDNGIYFEESIALCEDALFCHQYIAAAKSIYYLPQQLYHYNTQGESITRAKFSSKICTVFEAYRRIIEFCNKTYSDKKLNELLYANYYCHHIRNLRRMKNELSSAERVPFRYVYDFVKNNIRQILLNKKIRLKTKLLAVYLIFALKKQ